MRSSECLALASQAVEEFGGTVQVTMDDAIAAVFGIPHAHEDDPERAARTALRILEVVVRRPRHRRRVGDPRLRGSHRDRRGPGRGRVDRSR